MEDFIAYNGIIIDVRKLTPKPKDKSKEINLIDTLYEYQFEYDLIHYKIQMMNMIGVPKSLLEK